tara:strand:- start:262262 stop:262423 length:162 start_codon:yes stop_codon:yes gene_type:complete
MARLLEKYKNLHLIKPAQIFTWAGLLVFCLCEEFNLVDASAAWEMVCRRIYSF